MSIKPRQELREYQQKMKQATFTFFTNPNNKRLMVVSPTGTGKTTFFSSMVEDHVRCGERVLLTVHRIELVDQIVERLGQFGIASGVIAAGYPEAYEHPVQVGMVQSGERLRNAQPDWIYVDECHHSTAGSYQKLLTMFPESKLVGVTATPVRLDGKGFDDTYQQMINLYPIDYFFSNGFLVPPRHYFCANIKIEDLKETGLGDYDIAAMAKHMMQSKLIANVVESYRKYASGRKAVVFACNVEHSKSLANQFNELGIPAAHLDGQMDKTERKGIIRRYRKGELLVLTNYDIISEGFDVPDIEAVILARRTKSLSNYVQSVGRCLRPDKANGKTHGIVLDCVGQWLEHGFAGINYNWTLSGDLDEIIEPVLKTRLFKREGRKTKAVLELPEELLDVELIQLTEEMKRLASFETFLHKYSSRGGRFGETGYQKLTNEQVLKALDDYSDFLTLQGIELLHVEQEYLISRLAQYNIILPNAFWNIRFKIAV